MSATPPPPPPVLLPPPPPPPSVPQPAPPPEPSGGFPWIAVIVIGGIVALFLLIVVAIVGVGWLVFLKPTSRPTPVPPQQMQQMMKQGGTMPAPPPPPAAPAVVITADDAVAKVKALPDVTEWAGTVKAAGGSPHIDVDSEDATAYTVHVYEIVKETDDMPSHTATMGWYTVDKATGEVKEAAP
jgi:hypothetical protein